MRERQLKRMDCNTNNIIVSEKGEEIINLERKKENENRVGKQDEVLQRIAR